LRFRGVVVVVRVVHFSPLYGVCAAHRRGAFLQKYILPQCREKSIKCGHAKSFYYNFI
jgi:hypothetical protein